MSEPRGHLCLMLHAHLPFIRHPEHPTFLEEEWLFEAITECYTPLLDAFVRLADEGLPYRLTMSLTPPLVEMLRDPLLRERYEGRHAALSRLAADEVDRTAGTVFGPAAEAMQRQFALAGRVWRRWGGDLTRGFRQLAERGHLEIVTCGATHGFMPLMATRAARRAQVRVAVDAYEEAFGCAPRGIWLAECGYERDVPSLLADDGIAFFFVETEGVLHADPRPRFGVFAPVATAAGPVAFARDPECGRQVWSASEGYPGDFTYREYYRDLGFDGDYDSIRPYLHADGVRRNLGFKYHRVTGSDTPLHDKQPYDPVAAAGRALDHARHFAGSQRARLDGIRDAIGRTPVITAPYDAELFGHWWHEGPIFLEAVLRELCAHPDDLRPATPSQILAQGGDLDVVDVNPSSWGAEGTSQVWLNGSNGWMLRHLHRMERRMHALVVANPGASGVRDRLLRQAARELLLAQSSDWAFIVTNRTSVTYALRRFRSHVDRFLRIDDMLSGATEIDATWLAGVEAKDNAFGSLDYRVYARTR